MNKLIRFEEFEQMAGNRIFNVKFKKNNGVIRKFNARLSCLGVEPNYTPENGRKYIRCVTVPKKEIKMFDVDRILELSMKGQKYSLEG